MEANRRHLDCRHIFRIRVRSEEMNDTDDKTIIKEGWLNKRGEWGCWFGARRWKPNRVVFSCVRSFKKRGSKPASFFHPQLKVDLTRFLKERKKKEHTRGRSIRIYRSRVYSPRCVFTLISVLVWFPACCVFLWCVLRKELTGLCLRHLTHQKQCKAKGERFLWWQWHQHLGCLPANNWQEISFSVWEPVHCSLFTCFILSFSSHPNHFTFRSKTLCVFTLSRLASQGNTSRTGGNATSFFWTMGRSSASRRNHRITNRILWTTSQSKVRHISLVISEGKFCVRGCSPEAAFWQISSSVFTRNVENLLDTARKPQPVRMNSAFGSGCHTHFRFKLQCTVTSPRVKSNQTQGTSALNQTSTPAEQSGFVNLPASLTLSWGGVLCNQMTKFS